MQRTKLDERNAKICNLYKEGKRIKQIALLFKMSNENVRLIVKKNKVPKQKHSLYTEAFLITFLQQVSKQINRTPKIRDFQGIKPSISNYFSCFGSFNNAKKIAGLTHLNQGREPIYTEEYLLNCIIKRGKELGRTPTSREMKVYNLRPVNYKYHFGSWNKAVELSGFIPYKRGRQLKLRTPLIFNKAKTKIFSQ